MAEPIESDWELGKRFLADIRSCKTVLGAARFLAAFRADIQAQHLRELAEAEQRGYERGVAGEREACAARVRRLLDLYNVMRSLDAGEVVSTHDIELAADEIERGEHRK